MTTTATSLRKDLFRILDSVAQGQEVEVVHKGSTLRIAAVHRQSRLSRLVQPVDSEPLSAEATGWDAVAQTEWELERKDLLG